MTLLIIIQLLTGDIDYRQMSNMEACEKSIAGPHHSKTLFYCTKSVGYVVKPMPKMVCLSP